MRLFFLLFLLIPNAVFAWSDGSDEHWKTQFGGVVGAVGKDDFKATEALVRDVLNQSRITLAGEEPFESFFEGGTPEDDAEYFAHLDRWVHLQPESAVALLLRAEYEYKNGWSVRGKDYAMHVPFEKMHRFILLMQRAEQDTAHAIALDDTIPYARLLQLRILRGSEEAGPAFENAVQRYPEYYELYAERLIGLSPRWGGSTEEMIALTDDVMHKAPAGSVLRMLPVLLYKQLVVEMAFNCASYPASKRTGCVRRTQAILFGSKMQEWLEKAFALYTEVDKSDFNRVVVLSLMDSKSLYNAPYNKIIQIADGSLKDDYAFNLNYGNFYLNIASYEQAADYYARAMKEIETFPFTSDEERAGWMQEAQARRNQAYRVLGVPSLFKNQ